MYLNLKLYKKVSFHLYYSLNYKQIVFCLEEYKFHMVYRGLRTESCIKSNILRLLILFLRFGCFSVMFLQNLLYNYTGLNKKQCLIMRPKTNLSDEPRSDFISFDNVVESNRIYSHIHHLHHSSPVFTLCRTTEMIVINDYTTFKRHSVFI